MKDKEFDSGNFTVRLREDEDCDSLIKRFIKKTKKEGISEMVFSQSFHKKPSDAKRDKYNKRQRAAQKEKRKNSIRDERDY